MVLYKIKVHPPGGCADKNRVKPDPGFGIHWQDVEATTLSSRT